MAAEPEAGQWAAARVYCEGAPPSYALAAAMLGVATHRISWRARKEGWAKVDCRTRLARDASRVARGLDIDGPAPPAAAPADDAAAELAGIEAEALAPGSGEPLDMRLNRLVERLVAEVEKIGAGAAGRALDKRRLDALWTAIRTVEKMEAFLRDRAGDAASAREEEMADAFRQVHESIRELAYAHARELFARWRADGRMEDEAQPSADMAGS